MFYSTDITYIISLRAKFFKLFDGEQKHDTNTEVFWSLKTSKKRFYHFVIVTIVNASVYSLICSFHYQCHCIVITIVSVWVIFIVIIWAINIVIVVIVPIVAIVIVSLATLICSTVIG